MLVLFENDRKKLKSIHIYIYFIFLNLIPSWAVKIGPTETVADSWLSSPKGIIDLFLLEPQAWSHNWSVILKSYIYCMYSFPIYISGLRSNVWLHCLFDEEIEKKWCVCVDLQTAAVDIYWAHRVSLSSADRGWTLPGHGAVQSGRPKSCTGKPWRGHCLSQTSLGPLNS